MARKNRNKGNVSAAGETQVDGSTVEDRSWAVLAYRDETGNSWDDLTVAEQDAWIETYEEKTDPLEESVEDEQADADTASLPAAGSVEDQPLTDIAIGTDKTLSIELDPNDPDPARTVAFLTDEADKLAIGELHIDLANVDPAGNQGVAEQLAEIKPELANAGLLDEQGEVDVALVKEAVQDLEAPVVKPDVESPVADAVSAAIVDAVEEAVPAINVTQDEEAGVVNVSGSVDAPAVEEAFKISPELYNADGSVKQPVIDPNYGGQMGFDPTLNPDTPVDEIIQQAVDNAAVEELVSFTDKDLRAKLAGILTADQLAAFDTQALIQYDQAGVIPAMSARGNYSRDRRRTQVVKNWTNAALLDWLEGIVITPKGVDEELIYDEIYRRNRLPCNWGYETLKKYLLNGVQPEVSVNGLIIDDRMRDTKSLHHWGYAELRSALLDEIPTKYTKEELIPALRLRLGVSGSQSDQRLLDSLTTTPLELSLDNAVLKAKLEEYKSIFTRNPGSLTDATAGTAQHILYKQIRLVMKRDSQAFHEAWGIILDFVNDNYTVLFTPERARKGYAYLPIKGKELTIFEDLMTLIVATRSPVGRAQAAKQYQMTTLLRHVASEVERTNVVLFYTPH